MTEERVDPTIPIILSGEFACSCFVKNQTPPKNIPQNNQNSLINYLKHPNSEDKSKKSPSIDPLPQLW